MAQTLQIVRHNREDQFIVDGVKRWALRMSDTGDVELVRYASDGATVSDIPLAVELTTGQITNTLPAAGPAATAPAADAAVALTTASTFITLNSTTGAKAITTTSSFEGQRVTLFAGTVSGGSYTLAVTGGTLTLNSAGELATVRRVGSAWIVESLTASSSTAANVATVV